MAIKSIPDDVLTKYGTDPLDRQIEGLTDPNEIKQKTIDFYQSFLSATDYKCNEWVEDMQTMMADITATNFITQFIKFFIQAKQTYATMLGYRAFARGEIQRLRD